MEMTLAKMGCSMKNLEIILGPLYGISNIEIRHFFFSASLSG